MITIESVVVHLPKATIDSDLSMFNVRVVGSQMLEDGYELLIEGDESELGELVYFWDEEVAEWSERSI